MAKNFIFNPKSTEVAEAVRQKLAIEKLPAWAQNVEQIQKFFDDCIQYWFTPEQKKSIDGYIGDRSSQDAANKVFINEVSCERNDYQLVPTMVSQNAEGEVLAKLTYQDLVDNLKHYGSSTNDEDRIFASKFYTWTPPVNPDMILNFSNYYWDVENAPSHEGDYIVMERGSIDGNMWSLQNHWYHVNETKDGVKIVTSEGIKSGKFTPAKRPIIQYKKNIKLLESGDFFRGTVDVVCSTLVPNDINTQLISDNITVDGVLLEPDMKVLFTSINASGENNRVYRVVQDQSETRFSLALDIDFFDTVRLSGEPLSGDSLYVKSGDTFGDQSLMWNGSEWVFGQNKTNINQYPLFDLFDVNGVSISSLDGTDFNGSRLFSYKTNPTSPLDSVLGRRVELDKYQQITFHNDISAESYTYRDASGIKEIVGTLFYKELSTEGYSLESDWTLAKEPLKQYVKQIINVTTVGDVVSNVVMMSSSLYTQKYELAGVPSTKNGSYDVKVLKNGFPLESVSYSISEENGVAYISFDQSAITSVGDVFTVSFNSSSVINRNLGTFEVPKNLANNAKNSKITDISVSGLLKHFTEVIESQDGFAGSSSGINNYWETQQDVSLGTSIIQHEGSVIPLSVHNISDFNNSLNIIESCTYAQYEYNRFKNKFKHTLEQMDAQGSIADTSGLLDTSTNIIKNILAKINISKSVESPFYNCGVLSHIVDESYIPPTPQYLGILPLHEPKYRVRMEVNLGSIAYYNISHTGTLKRSYNQSSDDSEYANRLDLIEFTLEMGIYNSANALFKANDFTPRLVLGDVKSGLFRTTEYKITDSSDEFNSLTLIGFSNWVATNNVSLGSPEVTDHWSTWNWSTTFYASRPTVPAKGHWRGIYLDAYDTVKPHTHPWEMFGFGIKPQWWDSVYESRTIDGIKFYNDVKLWGENGTGGDVHVGRIRGGTREGLDSRYARPGIVKPHTLNGSLNSPFENGLVLSEPQDLYSKSLPWKYGDVSDVEFIYMNSNLYSFDLAMGLYRAKPAMWSSYFWDSANYKTFLVGPTKNQQYLKLDGSSREFINSDTVIHSNTNRVIGYQQWVVANLKKESRDVSKYQDIVQNSNVQLAYRLGGFSKQDNLTFLSDSFGLVSQENIHLAMNKSAVRHQEVLSAVRIEWDGSGYVVSGYNRTNPVFTYFEPNKSSKNTSFEINKRSFIKYQTYYTEPKTVPYNTRMRTRQDVVNFLMGYGEYLTSRGWIFEEYDSSNLRFIDWQFCAEEFASWSTSKPQNGSFISLTPVGRETKFGSNFGSIDSVTQYSGASWTLLNDENQGIYPYEVESARIGNVLSMRLVDSSSSRIAMQRVDLREWEHIVVFDNQTIFGDVIYNTELGLYQDKFRVLGTVTGSWNGRLEAPGFLVLENDLLPGFEKLVQDFRQYYDNNDPATSSEINNLSRHMIGFQTRNYLRTLIFNEKNQVNFYQGFIKEKGTFESFDKILRTSKALNTRSYKTVEEWAIKIAEFGDVDSIKKLEFNILSSEIKQDPQLCIFDSTLSYDSKLDDFISFYGTRGVDPRWVERSSETQTFPKLKDSSGIDVPSAGPVTLNEVDVISEDVSVLNNRRKAFEEFNKTKAANVWLLKDHQNNWKIYKLNHLDTNLVESVEVDEENGFSTLTFQNNVTLKQGDIFYIENTTTELSIERFYNEVFLPYVGSGWDESTTYPLIDPDREVIPEVPNYENTVVTYEGKTYQMIVEAPASTVPTDANYWVEIVTTRQVRVNLVIDDVDLSSSYIVQYVEDYDGKTKEQFISERAVSVPDNSLFDAPVVYNKITNQTIAYMSIWDPARGVVPGVSKSEIKYISQDDPALYNDEDPTVPGWAKSFVGEVWWDTSKALYLDYNQNILNSSGLIDVNATRSYKRENWGKMLPGSEIVLREWTRSPVPPSEWEGFVSNQSTLDKSSTWIPSGTADIERYVEIEEFDSISGTSKTYWYFWVRDAIYAPNVDFRNKSVSTLELLISDPLSQGVPWFAASGANEFIISGVNDIITDESSVLRITYRNEINDVNSHKEWSLVQETNEGNVAPSIWENLVSSLKGANKLDDQVVYPLTPLGNGMRKTWFKDLPGARNEFIDVVNSIHKNQNIVTNKSIMDNVFNYSETSELENSSEFTVIEYNNGLAISSKAELQENDPVIVYSDSTLPVPLTSNVTLFVHVFDSGVYGLKSVPSNDKKGLINITSVGVGSHRILKVGNNTSGTEVSFNMTEYWNFTDWYAEGYSKDTYYISSDALPEVYSIQVDHDNSDVIYRVTDSGNLWTLYRVNFARSVPYWETIGRQNGTVEINDSLIELTTNSSKAIDLICSTFDGRQNAVLFGMLYYVFQEQQLVDWAFKTSYIYVYGIEQILSSRLTAQLDQVDSVIAYFEEAKPYRTKIRSTVEQKTSDSDEMMISTNDVDCNSEETQKYYAALDKEANGIMVPQTDKPRLLFREQLIRLFFDRVSCGADVDVTRAEEYHEAFKKFNTRASEIEYIDVGSDFISPGSIAVPSISDVNQFSTDILAMWNQTLLNNSSYGVTEFDWNQHEQDFYHVHLGTTYLNDTAFFDTCTKEWGLLANDIQELINVSYEALKDLSQYLDQANRYVLNDKNLSRSDLEDIMNCGFQGTIINGTPSSRTPVGFSANTDDAENGYETSPTLYNHMISRGYTPQELEDFGFVDFNTNQGSVVAANDLPYNAYNPLTNDYMDVLDGVRYNEQTGVYEDALYVDDLNAFGSSGLEDNILYQDYSYSDLVDSCVLNVSSHPSQHRDFSGKRVSFKGLPDPSLVGLMDFGVKDNEPLTPYVYFNNTKNDRVLFLQKANAPQGVYEDVLITSINYQFYTLTTLQNKWIRVREISFNDGNIDPVYEVLLNNGSMNYDILEEFVHVDYQTNVNYFVNDIVKYSGKYYICIADTLGAFQTNKWKEIVRWSQNTNYVVSPTLDTVVLKDGVLWKLETSHVSGLRFDRTKFSLRLNTVKPQEKTNTFSFDFGTNYGSSVKEYGTFEVEGFIINHPTLIDNVIVTIPNNITDNMSSWRTSEVKPDEYITTFSFKDSGVTKIPVVVDNTLKVGDTVVLLSNGADRNPTGITFNDCSVKYVVVARESRYVELSDISGVKLVFNNSSIPFTAHTDAFGTILKPEVFTMVKINTIPSGSDLVITVSDVNYDLYYGRYLGTPSFRKPISTNGNSLTMLDHGFDTLDSVKFSAVQDLDFNVPTDVELFVRVINKDTFTVHRTIDNVVNNVPVLPNNNIIFAECRKLDYWYTGSVIGVQLPTNTPSNVDKGDVNYQSVSHGFLRPGIDSGSTEEGLRSSITEHVSISVFQDDRIYSIGQPNIDGIYSSGEERGKTFAFRMMKGSDEVQWTLSHLENKNSTLISDEVLYDEVSVSVGSEVISNLNTYSLGTEVVKIYESAQASIDPQFETIILSGTSSLPDQSDEVELTGPLDPVVPNYEVVPLNVDANICEFSINSSILVEGVNYEILTAEAIKIFTDTISYNPGDKLVCVYDAIIETIIPSFAPVDCIFSIGGEELVLDVDYVIDGGNVNVLHLYPAGTEMTVKFTDPNTVFTYNSVLRGANGSAEGGIDSRSVTVQMTNDILNIALVKHNTGTRFVALNDNFERSLNAAYFNTSDSLYQDFEYSTQLLYPVEYVYNPDNPLGPDEWYIVEIENSIDDFSLTLKESIGTAEKLLLQ